MISRLATLRLRLLIAYDGRPFRGWQSQATKDAVQDFVEAAFAKLLGGRVVVVGSGRTDAGVHASGQVAHADVPRGRLPLEKWQAALNSHLPSEIRILRATRAAADFHAQFDACGKLYTYRIWNAPCHHPLELGRAWFVPARLIFRRCARPPRCLVGRHDLPAGFAANRGRGAPERDTVRTCAASPSIAARCC